VTSNVSGVHPRLQNRKWSRSCTTILLYNVGVSWSGETRTPIARYPFDENGIQSSSESFGKHQIVTKDLVFTGNSIGKTNILSAKNRENIVFD
jgi:hypothetical protein